MAHKEPPLGWEDVNVAGSEGRLAELLVKLPCGRWAERDEYGNTLLHYACRGPNVAAVVTLLTSGLLDVNAQNKWQHTPAHVAANCLELRGLEALCAAGADMRARDKGDLTLIDGALRWARAESRDDACVRVLIANGVRLSSLREDYRDLITPELVGVERGVLRCRCVIVTLLGLKRRRRGLVMMRELDCFVVREVAVCVWATRTDKSWN